jgi:hypothetical protein
MAKVIATQSQPSSSSTITSSSVSLSCDNGAERHSKKPLINVLPSSKLLSRNLFHHKSLRKRRSSARLALTSNGASKSHQSSNGMPAGGERILNANFPSDLRAKIHSQMNKSPKHLQPPPPPPNFNRPPHQFMQQQRPPFNLFKFRPPFHNFPTPPHRIIPPPDDPGMSLSGLVPPTVILVPHPILLPIIIPVPLPLSAFWNAYQSKKSPEKPPPSSVNDNETQRDERRPDESEQPLDYTTKDASSPRNGDNEPATDSISSDRVETCSNGNNAERIPKFTITRVLNAKRDSQDFLNESNRPLRKRRIIPEVDDFSESS